MICSFLCSIGTEKLLKSASSEILSKVASIKLFGMDMFNTTAECIIDSLMKKDNVICNEKGLATGNGIYFSRNWSPTLERASISSQTVERPAIHGRNAGGIRR